MKTKILEEIEELKEKIDEIQCNLWNEYAPYASKRAENVGSFVGEFIKQEGLQLISARDYDRPNLYLDGSGQEFTIQKNDDNICFAFDLDKTSVLKISDCGNEGVELIIELSKVCECKIKINKSQISMKYDYYAGDRGRYYVDYGDDDSKLYTYKMSSDESRAIRYISPSEEVEDSTIDGITDLVFNICREKIFNEDDKEYGDYLVSRRDLLNDCLLRIEPVLKLGIKEIFMKNRVNILQAAADKKRNLISSDLESEEKEMIKEEIRELENMASAIIDDIEGQNIKA